MMTSAHLLGKKNKNKNPFIPSTPSFYFQPGCENSPKEKKRTWVENVIGLDKMVVMGLPPKGSLE